MGGESCFESVNLLNGFIVRFAESLEYIPIVLVNQQNTGNSRYRDRSFVASFNAGDYLDSWFMCLVFSASLGHQLSQCLSRGFGIHETLMHTRSINLQPDRNSGALLVTKPSAPIVELI